MEQAAKEKGFLDFVFACGPIPDVALFAPDVNADGLGWPFKHSDVLNVDEVNELTSPHVKRSYP